MPSVCSPGNELHVLFLDIELGKKAAGENGISAGRTINQMLPGCQIIFVTNHNEYSMDVYEVEHRGFIIKSEFENRFERALELLVKHSRLLTVNVKGKNVIYSLADICYIERGRRSCRLIMADSRREENPVIYQPFEEICGRIGNRSFVRCHNSYLVNLCYVRTYAQDGFLMSSGDRIPISRRYRNAVRDRFMEWQGKWV
ncbi:MAG: LytR/AlgR family response regulator transcription factor [Lachnospiraceae bacterium]